MNYFVTKPIASAYMLGTATGAFWTSGNGSPEGVVAAPVGSQYSRLDGGLNTTIYRKELGIGNTGWIATVTNSGGASSITSQRATVDFGTIPKQSDVFTLSFPSAVLGQNVFATPSSEMPANVFVDELELEPITVSARIPAAGTIELLVIAVAGGYITGRRNINYMVI